jgi:hypothetical protein
LVVVNLLKIRVDGAGSGLLPVFRLHRMNIQSSKY